MEKHKKHKKFESSRKRSAAFSDAMQDVIQMMEDGVRREKLAFDRKFSRYGNKRVVPRTVRHK